MTHVEMEIDKEFSLANFASTAERNAAMCREIANLRQFRSDVAQLSLYLCGGYYEPRNNDEAALAGRIIYSLSKSGADILRRESWMVHRKPIEIEVNKSGRLQMRQDQIDAYPDEG